MNNSRKCRATRVKDLGGRHGASKRSQQTLPRVVQTGSGNLSLPHQDLPETDLRLQNADPIGAHGAIGNTIDDFRRVEEACDGLIIQLVEFGEGQILIIEFGERSEEHTSELQS